MAFHYFSKLSAEIRNSIWELALYKAPLPAAHLATLEETGLSTTAGRGRGWAFKHGRVAYVTLLRRSPPTPLSISTP